MLDTISESVVRIVVAYLFLLMLSRFMGRKLISQITFFDFVVGIIVGSVAATMTVDQNNSFLSGMVILLTLALMTIAIDISNIKSFLSRKITDSEPVVLIENGKLNEGNLERSRTTINDLMMLLRENRMFNVADVEFALLETDGKLSVLPKSQKRPLTPADLKLPTSYEGLMKELVIDGNIMTENLHKGNLSSAWLIDQLSEYGIKDIREVFFAGLDTMGNLYVSRKNNGPEKEGEYGLD